MLRSLLRTFTAVGLCACQTAERTDPQTVRGEIESTNAKIARWYAAGQIDSVTQVFAGDVWQMPPNSAPLVGRDSVRAYWTNAVRLGRWDFEFAAADVATADSIAVERGHYTLRFTAGPKAPMPSFDDEGNYVALWRRESDGRWRIVWDAPVSTRPAAGAPSGGGSNR